jgi:hypothetical protein
MAGPPRDHLCVDCGAPIAAASTRCKTCNHRAAKGQRIEMVITPWQQDTAGVMVREIRAAES